MARRRMLNIDLILDDNFSQELSLEAQNMYLYLNMLADDDGIVGHLKRQLRMLDKNIDSVNELINHGYVLEYDPQTLVITDWLVNNHIRGDRYTFSREDDCRSSLFITYDWRFSLNIESPKVFIKYTQWINSKRTINGQTREKVSREELKQMAIDFHQKERDKARLPSGKPYGNQVGTHVVTDWVPPESEAVSGAVPVSDAVPDAVPESDIDKDIDKDINTITISSNGGMGEDASLPAAASTSTIYNNATREHGANSGEKSGVIENQGISTLSENEEINSKAVEALFDYLNGISTINIPKDNKRLADVFDMLIHNGYEIEDIQVGIDNIMNVANQMPQYQDEQSLANLLIQHLPEYTKQTLKQSSSDD